MYHHLSAADLLAGVAEILDPAEDAGLSSYADRAARAIEYLRDAGIHPGQRDEDEMPVPPPHDDTCRVCGGDR